MESMTKWILEQPHVVSLVQILLDLLLIVFFVFVFFRRLKVNDSGSREFRHSLEKILQQTETIAQEFEANLQQRRELINQVVAALDAKINQARRVCQDLEKLQLAARSSVPVQTPLARDQESKVILNLARKGLSASAIAERLKKPLGEIELVLSLRRLTLGQ